MPPKKRRNILGPSTLNAKRLRLKRRNETPEERQRRLEDIRIRASLYRAAETPEERELRREKQRIQAAFYRERKRRLKEAGIGLEVQANKNREGTSSHLYTTDPFYEPKWKKEYDTMCSASEEVFAPTSRFLMPEFQIKEETSTALSAPCWERYHTDAPTFKHEFGPKLAEHGDIEIDESLDVKTDEKPVTIKSEEPTTDELEDFTPIKVDDEPVRPSDSCIFDKCFGPDNGLRMLETLKDTYANKRHTNMKILDEDHNFVISIVSPFMQRIGEKLKQSSEMVFVSSVRSLDPLGCRVVMLLTNSFAGGLPLALIVTSPDTAEAFTVGVQMVRELVSDRSFGGRGKRGPTLFMIGGDNKAERTALLNVFPEARLLFCQFQIVTGMRCNIGKRKYNVLPCHKPVLLHMFKLLVYETDVYVFEQKVGEILNHSITLLYPDFRCHLKEILDDQRTWATCHRVNLITRGQTTNSLCAATVKVINKVFQPLKVTSPVHLLNVLMEDYQQLYIDKLVRVAYFRAPSYLQSKSEQLRKKCDRLIYFESDGKVFDPDREQTYVVDLEIGLCNCLEGVNGKMCEHLFMAVKNSNTEWFLTLPEKENERKNCMYLATGRYSLDESCRRLLREPIAIGKVVKNIPKCDLAIDGVDEARREPVFVTVADDEDGLGDWKECTIDDIDPDTIANRWWSEVAEQTSSEPCILNEIDDMLADLKTKAAENPSLLTSLKEMISSYKKVSTSSALESAMFCFAK